MLPPLPYDYRPPLTSNTTGSGLVVVQAGPSVPLERAQFTNTPIPGTKGAVTEEQWRRYFGDLPHPGGFVGVAPEPPKQLPSMMPMSDKEKLLLYLVVGGAIYYALSKR